RHALGSRLLGRDGGVRAPAPLRPRAVIDGHVPAAQDGEPEGEHAGTDAGAAGRDDGPPEVEPRLLEGPAERGGGQEGVVRPEEPAVREIAAAWDMPRA